MYPRSFIYFFQDYLANYLDWKGCEAEGRHCGCCRVATWPAWPSVVTRDADIAKGQCDCCFSVPISSLSPAISAVISSGYTGYYLVLRRAGLLEGVRWHSYVLSKILAVDCSG